MKIVQIEERLKERLEERLHRGSKGFLYANFGQRECAFNLVEDSRNFLEAFKHILSDIWSVCYAWIALKTSVLEDCENSWKSSKSRSASSSALRSASIEVQKGFYMPTLAKENVLWN